MTLSERREDTPDSEVKRGRGRPRFGERPMHRERIFQCARLYYHPDRFPIGIIAAMCKCSNDSVRDMVHFAINWEGPEGEEIRDMARLSRRRIKPKD